MWGPENRGAGWEGEWFWGSGVRGGTSAENGFLCILSLKNKSDDDEFDIFFYSYSLWGLSSLQLHQWLELQRAEVNGYSQCNARAVLGLAWFAFATWLLRLRLPGTHVL